MDLKKINNHAYILLALFLALRFFYPIVFSDRTLFLRDIHLWFYPMKAFLAMSLKSGSIPFWCPNTHCGAPFISDMQSGMFYPFSLGALTLFLFLWLRSLLSVKRTRLTSHKPGLEAGATIL